MKSHDELLRDMIVRHEGMELKPYRCSAGKITIGVGRNLEDRGISHDEAMVMLDNDIRISLAEAEQFPFWDKLSAYRKAVIIDMLINLGMPRLKGFKRMLEALDEGDYIAAAFEMENSKWAAQVGYRAEELADMMRFNRYLK